MRKSKFFRLTRLLAGAAAVCLLLSGCSGAVSNASDVQSDFSLTLPSSASSEALIETHGGFHGDGVTLTRYTFSQEDYDSLVAQARNGGGWQAIAQDGQRRGGLLLQFCGAGAGYGRGGAVLLRAGYLTGAVKHLQNKRRLLVHRYVPEAFFF
ncbi:MAG: hypothetical protein LUC48_10320 [Clostridiales bacterium]|nr:hypothetical protein [Clostridiales bacterium]